MGDVEAYYVPLEAQGRGSLHGHGLLWLLNMINSNQFKDLIKTEYFYTTFYLMITLCIK
jgi:hypothetical protein